MRLHHIDVKPECAITDLVSDVSARDTSLMDDFLARAPRRPRTRQHYLAAWRRYRGLTQEQLAERLAHHLADGNEDAKCAGFERSRLSKYETHVEGIREPVLMALAAVLNIEPGWLFSHPDIVFREQAILTVVGDRSAEDLRILFETLKKVS